MSQNTQSSWLRFRALLTEDGNEVLFVATLRTSGVGGSEKFVKNDLKYGPHDQWCVRCSGAILVSESLPLRNPNATGLRK